MASPLASTPDHLFTLRNFYLGAYQAAINCADSLPPLSPEESIEKESLVFRSYIALRRYPLVIDEIDESAETALQAAKQLAMYLSSSDSKIFLKMHGVDYAEKQLRIMQQIDEDHTLTQLANAWLDMAVGGSKIEEAYLIFQDFLEKYQLTGLVLNVKVLNVKVVVVTTPNRVHTIEFQGSKARDGLDDIAQTRQDRGRTFKTEHEIVRSTGAPVVGIDRVSPKVTNQVRGNKASTFNKPLSPATAVYCQLMGNFDEAETLLLEALNKDTKDPETLANLVVCSLHLDHVMVKRVSSAEESFHRAVQTVAGREVS